MTAWRWGHVGVKNAVGDSNPKPLFYKYYAVDDYRRSIHTRLRSDKAHLFRQVALPQVPYLCIPAHVSENRPYFLAAHFPPDVITSNVNFLSEDANGLVFAVISSSMFMAWQRTVGGRLESRLRFNKLLSWNTFPLPDLSDRERPTAMIAAGEAVLAARLDLSGVCLAGMYPPHGLGPRLQAAHDALSGQWTPPLVSRLVTKRPSWSGRTSCSRGIESSPRGYLLAWSRDAVVVGPDCQARDSRREALRPVMNSVSRRGRRPVRRS